MAFTNFRFNVVSRVVALAVLCSITAWTVLRTDWLVTPVICGALVLWIVVDLIRYVETTTREFTTFLSFVEHHDFSTPLSQPGKGRVFKELQDAYRLLTGEFRRLNLQRVAQHRHLEAVVEHVGIAFLCLDAHGDVTLMNEPARQLLGVPHLNSLHTLQRVDERLPDLLQRLGDGERAQLGVRRGDDTLQLMLYATAFSLLDQRYKLISIQNIRDELDRQEVDSWRKLLRVLTHEIMNSVTPITSLSRLIRDTMIDEHTAPPSLRALTPQEQHDMLRTVTAIHARSSGLLDFVQAYRSFSSLPAPEFAAVEVSALFERVRTLMSPEIEAARIALQVTCSEPELALHVDAQQMEQVLINLLRNAIEALASSPAPRIELRALRNDQGKVLLQVSDNGPGIVAEHLDSIFVPFFTTKRNGAGVGLSISRQILQANRGLISVRSTSGEGCVFTLKFP